MAEEVTFAPAAVRAAKEVGEAQFKKGFHLGRLVMMWTFEGARRSLANKDAIEQNKLTIGEFAKLANVTDDTIKNYRLIWEFAASKKLVPAELSSTMPKEEIDKIDKLTDVQWREMSVARRDAIKAEKDAKKAKAESPEAKIARAEALAEIDPEAAGRLTVEANRQESFAKITEFRTVDHAIPALGKIATQTAELCKKMDVGAMDVAIDLLFEIQAAVATALEAVQNERTAKNSVATIETDTEDEGRQAA